MTESATSASFANFTTSTTLAVLVTEAKCIADDVHNPPGFNALQASYAPNYSVTAHLVAKDGGDCFFEDSIYEFTIIEGSESNHVELAKLRMTCNDSDWVGVFTVSNQTIASFAYVPPADETLFAVEAHPYTTPGP